MEEMIFYQDTSIDGMNPSVLSRCAKDCLKMCFVLDYPSYVFIYRISHIFLFGWG